MASIDNIQAQLPRFYDKYNTNSVLYNVLSVCASVDDRKFDLTKRVDNMIGIDTTNDEDLEYRWGSLLSINKRINESYAAYRQRLKLAYPSLVGGTATAIKFAIASVIGITDDKNLIDNYIKVYDAWEYDGPVYVDPSIKAYGHIICTIDLSIGESSFDIADDVLAAINIVKASGTNPHVLYLDFKIKTYSEMTRFSYETLLSITYSSMAQS